MSEKGILLASVFIYFPGAYFIYQQFDGSYFIVSMIVWSGLFIGLLGWMKVALMLLLSGMSSLPDRAEPHSSSRTGRLFELLALSSAILSPFMAIPFVQNSGWEKANMTIIGMIILLLILTISLPAARLLIETSLTARSFDSRIAPVNALIEYRLPRWIAIGYLSYLAYLTIATAMGETDGQHGLFEQYLSGSLMFAVFASTAWTLIYLLALPFGLPPATYRKMMADGASQTNVDQEQQSARHRTRRQENNHDHDAQARREEELISRYPAVKSRRTMSDVLGMQSVKDKLFDSVRHFTQEGGNGILLYGEPGTGKTLLAEALSGETGIPILYARASELVSRWVGQTTEQINEVFDAARLQAPVLLFLDECDSLLPRRDGELPQDMRNTVNTLLTSLSDLNKDLNEHQILIIGATNHLQQLDPAGIREGRFDIKIEIPLPDLEARKELLRHGLQEHPVENSVLHTVARRWEGFSAARLRLIGETAARIATEENRPVDFPLLWQALCESRGVQGERLSEKVTGLNELFFREKTAEQLQGLVKMLRDPYKAEAYGGSLPRGALFYGPPGTGKTVVAQALAHETGWGFLATSGQALLAKPEEIDHLLQRARNERPIILFIDEAESVLADRGSSPWSRDVTNKLLAQMDGTTPLHDVFFIAATNHPDQLDPAMLRWGRFSDHIDFTPDAGVIERLLNHFIEKHDNQIVWTGDRQAFAESFANLSPADLIGLLTKEISVRSIAHDGEGKLRIDLDDIRDQWHQSTS